MFKISALAIAAALALSGCNSSTVANNIATDTNAINTITAALNTPSAQQAITTLQKGWSGLVCGIDTAATLTGAVAADMKATATVNGAKIAQMTSATLCAAAGGIVASTASAGVTLLSTTPGN